MPEGFMRVVIIDPHRKVHKMLCKRWHIAYANVKNCAKNIRGVYFTKVRNQKTVKDNSAKYNQSSEYFLTIGWENLD